MRFVVESYYTFGNTLLVTSYAPIETINELDSITWANIQTVFTETSLVMNGVR